MKRKNIDSKNLQVAELQVGDFFVLNTNTTHVRDTEGPWLLVEILPDKIIAFGMQSNNKQPFAFVRRKTIEIGIHWQIIRDGEIIF